MNCDRLPILQSLFTKKRFAGVPGDYGWQAVQYGTPEGHESRMKPWRDSARGGSFVEVGAHIGTSTMDIADLYKTVYAFEPSSDNFAILNHNIKLNNASNVVARQAALSNQCGRAKFYHAADGWSVCHSLSSDVVHLPSPTYEEVEVLTLDVALPDVTDCTAMQIDTEGNDIRVLQGAVPFINRQKQRPVMVIEFAPKFWSQSGCNVDELFSFMDTMGYNGFSDFGNNFSPVSHDLLREMFRLWAAPCWAWIDLWLLPR